ncbi:MAG: MFS transporter [Chloroflexi bacterium]|nr:MFS transporter [Chloroflexota bacterium]
MSDHDSRTLTRNFTFNILDGAFFGLGIGFGSFVTVLPLFVSQLTDSALLIGLIPAIHAVGWQFPQLLTAQHVARLGYFKRMVVLRTLHERVPYLFLALIAWFLPSLDRTLALVLIYLMLIWQGVGGGITATAWQAMLAKIIPANRLGSLYGLQAGAANLLASGGAIVAGLVLERVAPSSNFALCFMLTLAAMALSWVFLALVREERQPPVPPVVAERDYSRHLVEILRRDKNFSWFLIVRMVSQVALMAYAFFTVYAVRRFNASPEFAGWLTAVFTGSQILANPILGWLGDHWTHRGAMTLGAFAAIASALLAFLAPDATWFFPAFIFAGIANVAFWTVAMPMILQFTDEKNRASYIGLANTLIAPSTFLAPIVGGLLADAFGYPAAFATALLGGIATLVVLQFILRDPTRETENIGRG